MQNSQLPAKWLKPFAADDVAKVEIPLTSGDATRASQSLGFPPLTMQPPESGGVPPQGEDFNGAMNQVARIVWWKMAGGAIPFDNTWTTNAAIGGYPQGAVITSADLQGSWISTADNNTNNPDTNGTNWVPGDAYGATTVVMTNANVGLAPSTAAKKIIVITGTLTANVQLLLPTWVREWLIVNSTAGAFTVTVKTTAGTGVIVPQTGVGTPVRGDGTNIYATGATGRWINRQVITATAAYSPTPGTAYLDVTVVGGGGGGGGAQATGAGQTSAGAGGGGAGWARKRIPIASALGVTMTVAAGGNGGAIGGGVGQAGGTSSFGALVSASGGSGGSAGLAGTNTVVSLVGVGVPGIGSNGDMNFSGTPGWYAAYGTTSTSGAGGGSYFGGGAVWVTGTSSGGVALVRGAGGSGGVCAASIGTGAAGGTGLGGCIIIDEYA